MLFDCSLSLENEWLLSRDIPRKQIVILYKEPVNNDYYRLSFRFQWEKNNLFQFLYVIIATMIQACTKVVIFINTFSSSDQERKVSRAAKAGVLVSK